MAPALFDLRAYEEAVELTHSRVMTSSGLQ
jgi:hypothetical protein